MRKFALVLMALLWASPAWADVSLGIGNPDWSWNITNLYSYATGPNLTTVEHEIWNQDGMSDSGLAAITGQEINEPSSYGIPSLLCEAEAAGNVLKVAGTAYSRPKVLTDPGDNYRRVQVWATNLGSASFPNPPNTGAYTQLQSDCDVQGILKYRNVNGGWIKVVLKFSSWPDRAKMGGQNLRRADYKLQYNYQVYTNANDPTGSIVNTAGHLERTWVLDKDLTPATQTKGHDFQRHNIYGSMVTENDNSSWSDPYSTQSIVHDYAVIYVPDDAYFAFQARATSLTKTEQVTTGWTGMSANSPNAEAVMFSVDSVSANQVPEEWGGTMGNKPSPNDDVP